LSRRRTVGWITAVTVLAAIVAATAAVSAWGGPPHRVRRGAKLELSWRGSGPHIKATVIMSDDAVAGLPNFPISSATQGGSLLLTDRGTADNAEVDFRLGPRRQPEHVVRLPREFGAACNPFFPSHSTLLLTCDANEELLAGISSTGNLLWSTRLPGSPTLIDYVVSSNSMGTRVIRWGTVGATTEDQQTNPASRVIEIYDISLSKRGRVESVMRMRFALGETSAGAGLATSALWSNGTRFALAVLSQSQCLIVAGGTLNGGAIWKHMSSDPAFCGLQEIGGLVRREDSLAVDVSNAQEHVVATLGTSGELESTLVLADHSGGGFFTNDWLTAVGSNQLLLAGIGHGTLVGEPANAMGVYALFIACIAVAPNGHVSLVHLYQIRSTASLSGWTTSFSPGLLQGDFGAGEVIETPGTHGWPPSQRTSPLGLVVTWGG
jgi:hypothetical protein